MIGGRITQFRNFCRRKGIWSIGLFLASEAKFIENSSNNIDVMLTHEAGTARSFRLVKKQLWISVISLRQPSTRRRTGCFEEGTRWRKDSIRENACTAAALRLGGRPEIWPAGHVLVAGPAARLLPRVGFPCLSGRRRRRGPAPTVDDECGRWRWRGRRRRRRCRRWPWASAPSPSCGSASCRRGRRR